MVSLTEDQLKVKALLAETVTMLCKKGLKFSNELRIEGLIGVTVDNDRILLVNINEAVRSASTLALSSCSKTAGKVRAGRASTGSSASKHCDVATANRYIISPYQKCVVDGGTVSGSTGDSSRRFSNNVSFVVAGDSTSFAAGSTATAKKRKVCHSSEPEQTLSLLVEDELLGDTEASGTVKLERNVSDDSDVEPEEQIKISSVYSAVAVGQDADVVCSSWPTDQDADKARGSQAKVLQAKNWSTTNNEEPRSSGSAFDYLESYTCPECGLIVRTSVTLRDHIAGKHGEQPRFICSSCGKKFKWRSTFFYHRKSCNPLNH